METYPESSESDTASRNLEIELAVVGLGAYLAAHDDPALPFGIDDFAEPVNSQPGPDGPDMARNTPEPQRKPPTPRSCNQRQSDGSWATVVDSVD